MTISSLNVGTYSESSIVHTISQVIQQFGYNNTLEFSTEKPTWALFTYKNLIRLQTKFTVTVN